MSNPPWQTNSIKLLSRAWIVKVAVKYLFVPCYSTSSNVSPFKIYKEFCGFVYKGFWGYQFFLIDLIKNKNLVAVLQMKHFLKWGSQWQVEASSFKWLTLRLKLKLLLLLVLGCEWQDIEISFKNFSSALIAFWRAI